jgi:ABC-type branched-subunit amino acid transport system ATPase component/ABC-type branched-subunit amino acid transport system permease subunit
MRAAHAAAIAALAAFFAAAIALAALANGYWVFVIATVALTAVAGIGLNVLIGLSGQISFGHVGFYALGAYAVAIVSTLLKVSPWIALPAAPLVAALAGLALAVPALRASGPYLAMVTIAFGFIVENGAVEWRGLTGGQNGIMGIPALAVPGLPRGERAAAIVAIVAVAIAMYGYWRLARGTWGHAMRAVRDSETAAESIGIDPVVVKTVSFVLSAALAGFAGGLFAPLSGFVTPSTFSFSQSILFVLVVMIGGAGHAFGPVIGAVLVVLLPEMLSGLAEYRLLFFGAMLLIVLWAAPRGVMGTIEAWIAARRARLQHTPAIQPAAPPLAIRGRRTLAAEGLSIGFGGVKALEHFRLEARPGTVTALIGPNGAGKTTALNLLSGFYAPREGTMRLGDAMLPAGRAFRIARAGVARTYQTAQLFGSLDVASNLALARLRGKLGSLLGSTRIDDARAPAAAWLAFAGYAGDALAMASSLPHVDRRLAEIARALACDPDTVLLDEPAAGLAREDKERLAALLRRIAEKGIGIVLVEHDMALVMGCSDTVTVLESGRVIAYGTPAEVQADENVRRAYLGDRLEATPASTREPASGAAILEIGKLATGYGAGDVLKGIDLRVNVSEMVAVLGANGAGKSTLLRAIAGLQRPVRGGIGLAGEDTHRLPAHLIAARGLMLVPEGRQVFPELSVRDNLRVGAFLRGAASDARIQAMLERFPPLRERLAQRAGLLSGGEQQMLAIARALMGEPVVLLLDEPSLGLAPKVIADLFAALDRLRSERMTLLLVDQMAGLALAVADRGYVIEGGRIVATGTGAELAADAALERAYLGSQPSP